MPNDFMTLKALTDELEKMLAGGRINKINMPAEDEIYLDLRAKGRNYTLVLCARKPVTRLHLTSARPAFPAVPTAFCMLLRKYLIGGEVTGVSLLFDDRIAALDVVSKNELRDAAAYRLILELGGSSDLLLTDGENIIIDCVKRSFGEGQRSLLPGFRYEPPAQNKPNLFAIPFPAELPQSELCETILKNYVGASRETAKEIERLAQSVPLPSLLADLRELYASPRFSPCILRTSEGTASGFFAFPYQTLAAGTFENTPSMNAALEAFYQASAYAQEKRRATAGLYQTLKKLKAKADRKTAENAAKLVQCAEKDRYLQTGELIKCYAHQIEEGQKSAAVYDFYNDCETVIELDPALSPMKNAAVFFRKYTKLKGAETYALKERGELAELCEYLQTIEESLDACSTPSEYAEIGDELARLTGSAPANAKSAKKQKPSEPLRFEIGGFTVYIGKNNAQNDLVTFKLASGRDIWMHAKNYHGAHGVILTNGKEAPLSIIAKVASFVAYYSGAKNAPKADVDYTRRAFVRRLGKPGLVTYTDYKTVTVTPLLFFREEK